MDEGIEVLPQRSIIRIWNTTLHAPSVVYVADGTEAQHVKDDDEPPIFRYLAMQNKKAAEQMRMKAQQKAKDPPRRTAPPVPINKMTLKQLKDVMRPLGLNVTGTKEELRERYERFIRK